MKRRVVSSAMLVVPAAAAALLLALAGGCPLFEGPPGPEGPQGPPGPEGPPGPPGQAVTPGALPETVVEITSVNAGTAVNPGDTFVVNFTVTDGSSNTVVKEELNRFQVYVSGPTTNYQIVIEPTGDLDTLVQNADGSYTYTHPEPFPSVYSAPPNDSDAFGPDDGELTGQSLLDGTYTVAVEARQVFDVEGEEVRKAGDAVFDFIVGSGTLAPRALVTQANCNTCHANLQAHGGNRSNVQGCVLCHVAGGEDLTSADPAKATPGRSIEFYRLIHELHMGYELNNVEATRNSADPYRYVQIGFRESVVDYSDVKFPMMPGGTGFNAQMRNCSACHAGAAQEDLIYDDDLISQTTCQSCHVDIDFTTGTVLSPNVLAAGDIPQSELGNPANRVAPGNIVHTFSNDSCVLCHGDNQGVDIDDRHVPPLLRPEVIAGLKVVISSVTGASGGTFFQPGDTPVVQFNVLDGADNPFPIDNVSVFMVLAGPVDNYQRILPINPATDGSTLGVKGNGGVPTTGTGPFTYTSTQALPANFPAPFSDSAAFTMADGWGELAGEPLRAGNYTVMLYAYQTVTVGGTNYREASLPATYEIRVGSDGPTDGYAGLVTDAKCNSCHGDLRIHGNGRRGVANCVTCHTAGAEDRPNVVAGQTQAPEADSIDWKVMIHKIHNARDLNVVQEGGAYDIVGFAPPPTPGDTGNVLDFSTGLHPVMPIAAAACTSCHATDAWMDIDDRSDVNIWKVTCTSCHDSTSTAVHVQLNTAGLGQEGCAVCHGAGRAFDVESSHAAP